MAGLLDHETILTQVDEEVHQPLKTSTTDQLHTTGLLQHHNVLESAITSSDSTYFSTSSNNMHGHHLSLTSMPAVDTRLHPQAGTTLTMEDGYVTKLDRTLGQQHHSSLTEEFTSPETGCVSTATDPESLRFDFPEVCGNSSVDRTRAKKPPPTVYREQDRFVPINNTGRVMRNAVPKNAKISKDAKQCMQECISEFISFLTSEASDRCIDEKRKTITGDDILYALSTLGFDNYVQPLQLYLRKYREFIHLEKPPKDGESEALHGDDTQEPGDMMETSLTEETEGQADASTLQQMLGNGHIPLQTETPNPLHPL